MYQQLKNLRTFNFYIINNLENEIWYNSGFYEKCIR